MYIMIRMRRNLRLIDVFGSPLEICLLNPSLVWNYCLCCLVIHRLVRSLCSCCNRVLISIAKPYIMSIWWHLMISLMKILVIFVNDLALQRQSDIFIGAHLLFWLGSITRRGWVLAVLVVILWDLALYLSCVGGIPIWFMHLSRSLAMLDARVSVGVSIKLDVHLKIIYVLF